MAIKTNDFKKLQAQGLANSGLAVYRLFSTTGLIDEVYGYIQVSVAGNEVSNVNRLIYSVPSGITISKIQILTLDQSEAYLGGVKFKQLAEITLPATTTTTAGIYTIKTIKIILN